MMNLQMAKERVNQVDTVWIVMVKFVWKSRKVPQDQEYWKIKDQDGTIEYI